MERATPLDSRMLVAMVDRQFGAGFSSFLDGNRGRMAIERSKKTGKIRYVYLDEEMIFVLQPNDGFFRLTLNGAGILNELEKDEVKNGVVVMNDVASFINDGRNVFAKHVVKASTSVQPSQELYVCDENRVLLAVGKAILSGNDMQHFKRGVAVRVRHGKKA
ncbi:MAG: PUA domain-containing protein [Candidatus Hodarchaeota archaeon]